jgi:enoyl-CoA hydratase/carnithine racemase
MSDGERSPSPAEAAITALTVQACRAAEQGDWDQVEQCVSRRGELLDRTRAIPHTAVQLVELDLRIQALGRAAQTALDSMLREVGQTRRHLRQLQRGSSGKESERNRFMNVTA